MATIQDIDAQLIAAGLPSYSELAALLGDAAKLGLTFDIGNAYIRRSYIDEQESMQSRIQSALRAIRESQGGK